MLDKSKVLSVFYIYILLYKVIIINNTVAVSIEKHNLVKKKCV